MDYETRTNADAMDWEDWLDEDENEPSRQIPDGNYMFRVLACNREFYPGSAKLPPCKKIVANLQIFSPSNPALAREIRHNFFLLQSQAWRIKKFFAAIGLRKPGTKSRMDFNAAVGRTGRCRIKSRNYRTANGEQRSISDIAEFYPAADAANSAPAPAPVPASNPVPPIVPPMQQPQAAPPPPPEEWNNLF